MPELEIVEVPTNMGMWLGILPIETILTTIITYGLGKVLYEVVVYPLTRAVIKKVKEIPDNHQDTSALRGVENGE